MRCETGLRELYVFSPDISPTFPCFLHIYILVMPSFSLPLSRYALFSPPLVLVLRSLLVPTPPTYSPCHDSTRSSSQLSSLRGLLPALVAYSFILNDFFHCRAGQFLAVVSSIIFFVGSAKLYNILWEGTKGSSVHSVIFYEFLIVYNCMRQFFDHYKHEIKLKAASRFFLQPRGQLKADILCNAVFLRTC